MDFWKHYYNLLKDTKHTSLLEKAIELIKEEPKKALDIGAGNLRDTKFLLENGFEVTAIDPDVSSGIFAKELNNPKLTMIQDVIGRADLKEEFFSLVNAQEILFHFPKERLILIIARIYKTLKREGVFCANFLGERDDWNTPESEKTFFKKEELIEVLGNFEIIELIEEDIDGTTAKGQITGENNPKHWHYLRVIVKKQ